jgi:type IV pilus assembly protein PilC
MDYLCRVGTPTGEVLEETFTARDEAALRSVLQQKGYYLFSARRALSRNIAFRRRRVSVPTLLIFCQELAALLKAGLPLFQSLDVMLERQRDTLFRQSLAGVREKVKAGTSLSDGFRDEGELYPAVFSASLLAGERAGSLETVLRRFVRYLRLSQSLKKKAIAASVYPLVLLAVMSVVVGILLVVVIPSFRGFYEELGGELPPATRALMTVAGFLNGNLYWIAPAIFLVVALTIGWLRREGSPLVVDRTLLRLPLVGPLFRMYATSQLARTLSTLLAGGLPLLNSLEISAASVGNRAVGAAASAAAPQVREGRSLSTALESTHTFDPMALEMVKVGEQTGALGEMLESIAEFYDEELDTRVTTVIALAEPAMLVFMAVIVGGMLVAFYLPLFKVFSVIR